MEIMSLGAGGQKRWCRRGESNPRPRDYETLALPLSYAGTNANIDAKDSALNVSSLPRWYPKGALSSIAFGTWDESLPLNPRCALAEAVLMWLVLEYC